MGFLSAETCIPPVEIHTLNRRYDIWQIALIHYKAESMRAYKNLISIHMALFELACVRVHRGRGSFAVLINYTEEGQRVGDPDSVLWIIACWSSWLCTVWERGASCNCTQSPNWTKYSLGMLQICAKPCIPKKVWSSSGGWGEKRVCCM